MKRFLFILLIALSITHVKGQAQNTSEWLRQKNTQKKYLVQQIAALQVHLGGIKKGYRIARKGLQTISDVKNGEYNLHGLYFQSLKTVNPNIRKYGKIAEISLMQVKILRDYKQLKDLIRTDGMYNNQELEFIEKSMNQILDNCEQVISELIDVLTDGKLELKDDERLERIDKLYEDIQENASLSRSFSKDVIGVSANRATIKNNIQSSRKRAGLIQ